MKVEYHHEGSVKFETEDGRDSLFLGEFINSIPKQFRPLLSNFISISIHPTYCDKDGSTISDDDLLKAFEGKHLYGQITDVTIVPYAKYSDSEIKKAIKKLLKFYETH